MSLRLRALPNGPGQPLVGVGYLSAATGVTGQVRMVRYGGEGGASGRTQGVKRKLSRMLWLAVGLPLLAWVIWQAGLATTGRAFMAALAHPWLLAGVVGLFLAAHAVFFLKWHLMCRIASAPVDARQSLRLFATLYLLGTFTPGRGGELVAPLVMRAGGRLTAVALVNRLLEGLGTVFASVLVAWVVFRSDPRSGELWRLLAVLGAFLSAVVVLSRRRVMGNVLGVVRRCLNPFRRLGPVAWLLRLQDKHANGIGAFYSANERLLRPWPVLLLSVLLVAIWVMITGANCLLIQAVVPPGEKAITFATVFAVMMVGTAAMFLSPIPSGVGLTEVTAVALFQYLGHPQPELVSFLLLWRVLLYTAVLGLFVTGQLAGRPLPQAPRKPDRPRPGAAQPS